MSSPNDSQILQLLSPLLTPRILLTSFHLTATSLAPISPHSHFSDLSPQTSGVSSLLTLCSPHPHFSSRSLLLAPISPHSFLLTLTFPYSTSLHPHVPAPPAGRNPHSQRGAVRSPFLASAAGTLTRRRGRPQSCCSASGTSCFCGGRRARVEMDEARRAATSLLPASFARLPAAIAAPATRAGLDAWPLAHWP